MQSVMEPIVPADLNLRDFAFMPLDVHRLLTSETWMLGTGDERAAAMTLWLASWHEVPAGSLPDNDRMLERLANCKTWRKVRAHALRGWVSDGAGRLYHPVVCEKALEAWLEKLEQRLSGSAGNAKRWKVEFDAAPIEERIDQARVMLARLNPDSRALKKKRPMRPSKVSGGDATPTGPAVGPGSGRDHDPIAQRSQETGTGTETGTTRASELRSPRARPDQLPAEVDDDAWFPWVDHWQARRKWSAAREMQACGHLRVVINAGGDPNAVLRWALSRTLADLADAYRRMDGDAARQQDRREGESLADSAARQIATGDGIRGLTVIPMRGAIARDA